MIHGNSNDPVLVKKIALQIWTLRDEIEAMVLNKLQENPNLSKDEAIKQLTASYHRPEDNVIQFPDAGNEDVPSEIAGEDNAEDEMAKALAEAEAEEEVPSEIAGEDNAEDEMAKALAEAEAGGDDAEVPSEIAGEDNAEDEMAKALAEAEAGGDDAGGEIDMEQALADAAKEEGVKIVRRRPNLPPEKLTHGKTILSEISMEKIFFFADRNFLEGQSVIIDFLIPKRFSVCATINYCRAYNMKSRIISKRKLPNRIMATFTFSRPGERTLLRDFLMSVEPDVPAPTKKKAVASHDDDDDDDFSELDDL